MYVTHYAGVKHFYSAYSAFLIYAEKALTARTDQFAADPVGKLFESEMYRRSQSPYQWFQNLM